MAKSVKLVTSSPVSVKEDNWRHRSSNMSCNTCMYYVPKCNAQGIITKLGRCRRNAPTMNGYPVVFQTDWCGQHKLDENKI